MQYLGVYITYLQHMRRSIWQEQTLCLSRMQWDGITMRLLRRSLGYVGQGEA